MLIVQNITVTVNKGTSLERSILKNVDLNLQKGEYIIIVGGNGAGKSTLFDVISGVLKPQAGKIIIDNKDYTAYSCVQRSHKIARVLQDPRKGTMENMTIFENLAFAEKRGKCRGFFPFYHFKKRQRFKEKLSLLNMGLEDRLDSLVAHLSGGQRQALSLIMSIIAPSCLLLLDEITAALDPQLAEVIMEIAQSIITQEQKTCMMITHNMAHALRYGDRTLILEQGQFVKTLTKAEKQYLTPACLAATFVKDLPLL